MLIHFHTSIIHYLGVGDADITFYEAILLLCCFENRHSELSILLHPLSRPVLVAHLLQWNDSSWTAVWATWKAQFSQPLHSPPGLTASQSHHTLSHKPSSRNLDRWTSLEPGQWWTPFSVCSPVQMCKWCANNKHAFCCQAFFLSQQSWIKTWLTWCLLVSYQIVTPHFKLLNSYICKAGVDVVFRFSLQYNLP